MAEASVFNCKLLFTSVVRYRLVVGDLSQLITRRSLRYWIVEHVDEKSLYLVFNGVEGPGGCFPYDFEILYDYLVGQRFTYVLYYGVQLFKDYGYDC